MADQRPRVAEVIDGVNWDYDPENEQVSPLVSTRRYFRDFPWEAAAATPTSETGPDRG
jgi:hypothetical protein